MVGREKTSWEPLSPMLEQQLADSRVSVDEQVETVKCEHCKSEWWMLMDVARRDYNSGGRISKIPGTTFQVYQCLKCGFIDVVPAEFQGLGSIASRQLYQAMERAVIEGKKLKEAEAKPAAAKAKAKE